jgi:glutamyl-tRNA synthetase
MSDLRARFAPAPSGNLHVGSAHTALFNWLFTRHSGGTFVLRIEDTDASRSTVESAAAIEHGLTWLGLDWDEGPFFQSERHGEYLAAAERLLASGVAYECYCTEDELQRRNEDALKAGRPLGYDGTCRDLTTEERAARAAEGRPRSIRFRTPDEGVSSFVDLIRGEVAVEWALIPDFVIVRSSGAPVFFLANAVDDAAMGITHVIRGEDLLDSTHRVLALRRALDLMPLPDYAHLAMLLGTDRAKLSKRHGAMGLDDFRQAGILPEALLNYLALLGFSLADGREIATADEIVSEFMLERVTHAGAVFDQAKLEWMNGEYIRKLSADEFAERTLPFARERFGDQIDESTFRSAMVVAQERAKTLVEGAEHTDFLWTDDGDFTIAPESWEMVSKTERLVEIFDIAIVHVLACGESWTAEALDLRPALEAAGFKPRKAMPPLYAAVEGRHTGLPLFESMWLLGRDRTLRRLEAARDRAAG